MKFAELKANWPWMLKNISDDEPVVFPRRSAKKRAATGEKRSRIIFDCTTEGYKVFHTERERLMQEAFNDNPTIFDQWLCDVLQSWTSEQARTWKESYESETRHD